MKNILNEFKTFISRGNVMDMAIGIIIGAAFTGVVHSLVNDIIMPAIGLVMGQTDFSQIFINLSGESYATLKEAQDAGAATINVGLFVNAALNFLIVALVIFIMIKAINQLQRSPEAASPDAKDCPYCFSKIPIKSTRCPQCTSQLEPAARSQGTA